MPGTRNPQKAQGISFAIVLYVAQRVLSCLWLMDLCFCRRRRGTWKRRNMKYTCQLFFMIEPQYKPFCLSIELAKLPRANKIFLVQRSG